MSSRPDDQGGYLVESYRSTEIVTTEKGDREAATHIYFLLHKDSPDELFHLLLSDEVWHFYMGDPVTIIELDENAPGSVTEIVLGNDLLAGQSVTHVVKRNIWFGGYLNEGYPCGWSLVGCSVSPGFEVPDFILDDRDQLLARYPKAPRELILKLTRD